MYNAMPDTPAPMTTSVVPKFRGLSLCERKRTHRLASHISGIQIDMQSLLVSYLGHDPRSNRLHARVSQDMHLGHSWIQDLCQLLVDFDGHVAFVNFVNSALQIAVSHAELIHFEGSQ
jgi:hypothetical protein